MMRFGGVFWAASVLALAGCSGGSGSGPLPFDRANLLYTCAMQPVRGAAAGNETVWLGLERPGAARPYALVREEGIAVASVDKRDSDLGEVYALVIEGVALSRFEVRQGGRARLEERSIAVPEALTVYEGQCR